MNQAYLIAKNLTKKGFSKQEALGVLDDAKAWIERGVDLKECQHCNAVLDKDAKYCTHCGKEVN